MPLAALSIWPFIAILLVRGLGRVKGLIWATMIGALFLPEAYAYDLPGLPPMDKNMAVIVGVLLGVFFSKPSGGNLNATSVADSLAKQTIFGLAGLLLLSSFLTVLNNSEALVFGPVWLRGLGFRDLIAMIWQTLVFLIPYFLAQRYLSDPSSHVILLKAFVLAGLGYSLLVLFEVRMSPQLHTWTYGYFQHIWLQHVRGGNFRPIVFQPHGLWIGLLLLVCAMSAFTLLKSRVKAQQPRIQYFLIGIWFLMVLGLSRNFGAAALAFMFVPILWFFGPRFQVWVCIAVMSTFLVFPALRQSGIVTFERTLGIVGNISEDRQWSLNYRIENEALFLKRAAIKPITGWGIWARWRIRDSFTGQDVSTADGQWVIVLGERGWLGYIAYFGLLTAPIFFLLRTRKRRELAPSTTGLALIMAATIIYQIPNNTVGPLTLLIAGALAGFVWRGAEDPKGIAQAPTGKTPGSTRPYTRFPNKNRPRTI
jgi:hypothetical protein